MGSLLLRNCFLVCSLLSGAVAQWDAVTSAFESVVATDATLMVATSEGIVLTHTKGTPLNTMPIASASKWVTAYVVSLLVQDGVLSYDDKVSDHINWWTKDPLDGRSNITLSHLLSFTSGFVEDDCCGNSTFTPEECAMQIYDTKFLRGPAGTKFWYASSHLQVVGVMVEAAVGSTLQSLFGSRVRSPLGLAPSTLYIPMNNPLYAGGLTCSTSDYMKILEAIFLRTQLNSTYTELMEADSTPSSSVTILFSPATLALERWHYGFSNWIVCHSINFLPSCLTNRVNSSPGAFGFIPWIDRGNGYYATIGTLNIQANAASTSLALSTLRPLIEAALQSGASSATEATGNPSSSSSDSSTSPTSTSATSSNGPTEEVSPSANIDIPMAVPLGFLLILQLLW